MKTRPAPARLASTVTKKIAVRCPGPHRRRAVCTKAAPTRESRTADLLASELRQVIDHAETRPSALIPEVLLDKELDGFRVVITRTPSMENHNATLSPREMEIARMIGKGLPNKMIADVLEISTWTVGTHLRRIFAKLSVPSRAAMIAKLLEHSAFLSISLSVWLRTSLVAISTSHLFTDIFVQ